jgi:hypothetical protein
MRKKWRPILGFDDIHSLQRKRNSAALFYCPARILLEGANARTTLANGVVESAVARETCENLGCNALNACDARQ